MIKIKSLSKSYDNNMVLNDINIDISSPCFICLSGPSGCGKSTLLNILSLMDTSFDGDFFFNDENVKQMNLKRKEELITNQITYLFQDPKLIENESIRTNVNLISNMNNSKSEIEKYLKMFSLNLDVDDKVSVLSKGEKKRITLIGALLRNNPLVLCDEITSGLDEENSKMVLSLLKKMGKEKIVILVTHDLELVSSYCKDIYIFKNNRLEEIKISKERISTFNENKNNKLPIKYIFNHILKVIKGKRLRTLLLTISMVLCLFTMGLSLLISKQMKEEVASTLTSYFDTNQILVKKKEEQTSLNKYLVVDSNEFDDFYKDFSDLIVSKSNFYIANFSDYFHDENLFYLKANNIRFTLEEYGINNINEFVPLDLIDEEIYPSSIKTNNKSDIVISLSERDIFYICNYLKLEERNKDGLAKYLVNNTIEACFSIKNNSWEYQLEIPFNIVGFVVSNLPMISSTYSLFNEYYLEEVMQLPYSYSLNEIDYYPWTIKKLCTLIIKRKNEAEFYNRFLLLEKMNDYSFHILNEEKGGSFLSNCSSYSQIYFTYKNKGNINVTDIEKMCFNNQDIEYYLPCGSQSFSVDETSLINGFDQPTYLSSDIDVINKFIDYNSFSKNNYGIYQSGSFISNNDNFFSLSKLDCSKENFVKFIPYVKNNKKLLEGRYPKNEYEILVSSSLIQKLKMKIGQEVYLLMMTEIKKSGDEYQNIFKNEKFQIVGIVESEKKEIYQQNLFPLILSNVIFKVPSFDQQIDKVLIKSKIPPKELINKLSSEFKEYSFTNPMENYLSQIDRGMNYLSLFLLSFSIITLVSSLSMMILVNYLFYKETEKEIAIYSFLGYSRSSIFSLYLILSGLLCLLGVISSYLSLIISFTIIPYASSNIEKISFSLYPFLIILIVSLVSYLITNLFTIYHLRKNNLIEIIK